MLTFEELVVNRFHCLVDDVREADVNLVERDLAGRDAGAIEQIVYEVLEVAGLAVDDVTHPIERRVTIHHAFEKLRAVADGGKRIS